MCTLRRKLGSVSGLRDGRTWQPGCARGFCNSGKATRRMGKKSLFPLYPPHSPHPSLACTEYASTEEGEMRAEHGVGSSQHNSQIPRLAERPIQ